MYTRYEVKLQPEGHLTVVEQNRQKPHYTTGSIVRLVWQREHIVVI
jgi:TOBE domain